MDSASPRGIAPLESEDSEVPNLLCRPPQDEFHQTHSGIWLEFSYSSEGASLLGTRLSSFTITCQLAGSDDGDTFACLVFTHGVIAHNAGNISTSVPCDTFLFSHGTTGETYLPISHPRASSN